MNKFIEEYKNNFIKNCSRHKIYIDRKDLNKLNEDVFQERGGFNIKYYIKAAQEMSDDELGLYVKLRTLEKLEEISEKQSTIEGFVIFLAFVIVGCIIAAIKLL